MPIIQNIAGQKFGRLTAVDVSHRKAGKTYWNCACECGESTKVTISKLRSGWTVSCGCYLKERQREARLTHGMSGSSELQSYSNMMTRCYNPKCKSYSDYGGRGIKVCERWRGERGRQNFLEDMGNKPSRSFSIERRNVNQDYEPDNCFWADRITQGQNTRRTRNFTYNGKTQCMSAWNRELGLSETGILTRLKNGWHIERILSTPNLKVVRQYQSKTDAAGEKQNSADQGSMNWAVY